MQVVNFAPVHEYCNSFFWAGTDDEQHAVEFDAKAPSPLDGMNGEMLMHVRYFGAGLRSPAPPPPPPPPPREYIFEAPSESSEMEVH